MKKLIFFLLLLTSCSINTTSSNVTEYSLELTYQKLDGSFITKNISEKDTMIIFWADYWSICRQELPVLEDNLINLKEYNVIALAHSDLESTKYWVENNLKGLLNVGISTKELRDRYKIIGQPITIILNTSGEVVYREFGTLPTNGF